MDVLRSARAAGIDVLCITDHGTIEGAREAAALAAEAGRRRGSESFPAVVVGQECRTWAGEIIGLFLNERIPGNLQPDEVLERIEAQGGLVYIPHPFCKAHNSLRREVLDDFAAAGRVAVLEVHNAKAEPSSNLEAAQYARRHGIVGAAGSDAHYAEFVGRAYVETDAELLGVEDPVAAVATNPSVFLEALRRGRLHCGTYSYSEASWPRRV